jgi:hypothetical protein
MAELKAFFGVCDTSDKGTGDRLSPENEWKMAECMFVSEHSKLDNVTVMGNKRKIVSNLMRSRNGVDDNIALVGCLGHGFWVSRDDERVGAK